MVVVCVVQQQLMWKVAIQVTGEQLQQVLHEVRRRVTPEEGRAIVSRALRDRDQADSEKWQVLQPLLQDHSRVIPGCTAQKVATPESNNFNQICEVETSVLTTAPNVTCFQIEYYTQDVPFIWAGMRTSVDAAGI